jgi:hypothetical protein
MFDKKANTMFYMSSTVHSRMSGMEKIHPTMQRLYLALGTDSKSWLLENMGESDQAVNNWLKRGGLSKDGALKAQRIWGINAIWLLTGEGPQKMQADWPFKSVSEEGYRQLTEEQQGVVQGRADALIEQMLNTHDKTLSYKGIHTPENLNVPQTSRSISRERSERLEALGIFDATPGKNNDSNKTAKARKPRAS